MSDEIKQAEAIAASIDRGAVSVDLSSAVSVFEHRMKSSEAGALAHARAVLKIAAREGVEVPSVTSSSSGGGKPKKADLRARVDELGLDVPSSATVADLQAALDAHDAAQD
jgi:hypothetical protein